MYVTCELLGGLGNQLFQIAITLATAKQYDLTPIFYESVYYGNTYRSTYFNTSLLKNKVTIDDKGDKQWIRVSEHPSHLYSPIGNQHNNICLYGYFQTSKYFDKYRDYILQTFKLNDDDNDIVDNKIKDIKNKLGNRKLVSLHVRRTDYCQLNWHLPIDYYKEALTHFDVNNCGFVIVSDDIEWCKEILTFIPNTYFLSQDKLADYLEMFVISKCQEHIMSNSSYNWWSVYLGDIHKDKKVITPYPWFRNTSYNPYIYENHWLKINYS